MFSKTSLINTILAASVFTSDVCLGFKRTAPDVSPSSTAYTVSQPFLRQAGIFNLTKSQIIAEQALNSYWTIYFLHGSNDHDYFVVGHFLANGTTSPPTTQYRVSLLDINDGVYFGETFNDRNSTFATNTLHYKTDRFESYSTTPDLFTIQVSKSTVEDAEFNLVSSPRGPNFFDAGNGFFFWGTDWTYEYAFPEQWVTGNITYKGEVIDIIPEKSMSWLDRQYGPTIAPAGWNLFIIYLEDGTKLTVWHSGAVGDNPAQVFATAMFPDGHHEVYPVDEDIHPSVPFTSTDSNFTYYANHKVSIPDMNAYFDIEQPVFAGEMTQKDNPLPTNTLFEGYAVVKAHVRGKELKGWGVAERCFPFQ